MLRPPRPTEPPARTATALVPILVLAVLALAGCGSGGGDEPHRSDPRGGAPVTRDGAVTDEAILMPPSSVTKNTSRIPGADAIADAAAAALAVFPSRSAATRPRAVVLADADAPQEALSAAQLMSEGLRAPLLLADGPSLPPVTVRALAQLHPGGLKALGGAQVIRVGDVPTPDGLRSRAVTGANPAAVAGEIDALVTRVTRQAGRDVVVAPSSDLPQAMAAAAWAAQSGTPLLWTDQDAVPAETLAAIGNHSRPRIVLLGPQAGASNAVERRLARLGKVVRVGGGSPGRTSVLFARLSSPDVAGWGITDPGHGFVFASAARPLDAAAGAVLSASGTHGPLLVLERGDALPDAVETFLLDVQPGYTDDPTRGVYNHGWLMGDPSTVSVDVQARIDAILEIQPVRAAEDAKQP